MKVVILAGGLGSRLSEETHLKPKPMVEIGGRPILWHIMKLYHGHGVRDFIICCGFRGYVIKEYFGGRLKRVADYLEGEESFCFTYGDGLSDVDISAAIGFHKSHGRLATVTAVRPPARFGALKLAGDEVQGFIEKPQGEGGFINGGFFVLSNAVLDRIEGDRTSFEGEPLAELARDGELRAFFHRGFWQPMDTLRDKTMLEALWTEGVAPWKSW